MNNPYTLKDSKRMLEAELVRLHEAAARLNLLYSAVEHLGGDIKLLRGLGSGLSYLGDSIDAFEMAAEKEGVWA